MQVGRGEEEGAGASSGSLASGPCAHRHRSVQFSAVEQAVAGCREEGASSSVSMGVRSLNLQGQSIQTHTSRQHRYTPGVLLQSFPELFSLGRRVPVPSRHDNQLVSRPVTWPLML